MNFYFQASEVLDRVDSKQGSIKGILANLPDKERKRIAALVIETLKYKHVLMDVIKDSNLMRDERKKITSHNLALVLVHDLLLAKGIQAGDGPVKQAILRHKTRLHSEFTKIKIKRGARSNAEIAQTLDHRADLIPRYVRVNTLRWSTTEAIEHYQSKGFKLSDPLKSKDGLAQDEHIPDLLVFAPETSFQDDPLYKTGHIILQDKASCFPAVVLDPPASEGAMVIDATAAPGNKTSHLSALMQSRGKLFAFEKDRRRFATLTTMLSKAVCKNVEPINVDFLTVGPTDPKYSPVTHILLDPSCSGSGILNRLDHLLETEEENEAERKDRLNKLANFQLMMIKHAMRFPNVVKIVYSTCSIYAAENEHVIRQALLSEEAQAGRFHLATRADALPSWPRRGIPEEIGDAGDPSSLVRCLPGEDATNGFFVSCFKRDIAMSSDIAAGASDHKRQRGEDHHAGAIRKRKKRKSAAG